MQLRRFPTPSYPLHRREINSLLDSRFDMHSLRLVDRYQGSSL